jgi:formate/nitrite transporter FocA (FNT family)
MPSTTFVRLATVLAATAAGLFLTVGTAAAAPEEVENRDDVEGVAIPVTANVFGSTCSVNVMAAPEKCNNVPDEVSDIGF